MLALVRRVAVTGGLSCGKSSVCRILQECGARTISADQIVHQLLSSDPLVIDQVVSLFGDAVLEKGQISRRQVRERVSRDFRSLTALENILHPAVYRVIQREAQEVVSLGQASFFVAEVPLLFESRGELLFETTVAVISPVSQAKKRFFEQFGEDEEDFAWRSDRQMALLEKAKRADFVLLNSRDLPYLRGLVKELYGELCRNDL